MKTPLQAVFGIPGNRKNALNILDVSQNKNALQMEGVLLGCIFVTT
jgi:hypothetical protein